MFCLSGGLTAVYGEENDIPISAGDNFMCETGVRARCDQQARHRRWQPTGPPSGAKPAARVEVD